MIRAVDTAFQAEDVTTESIWSINAGMVCCMLLFIFIILMVILYQERTKSNNTYVKCPICRGDVSRYSGECIQCGYNYYTRSKTTPPQPRRPYHTREDKRGGIEGHMGDVDRKIKKSTESVGALFGKKHVCSDCRNELVYREEYQSWYCYECHTYK